MVPRSLLWYLHDSKNPLCNIPGSKQPRNASKKCTRTNGMHQLHSNESTRCVQHKNSIRSDMWSLRVYKLHVGCETPFFQSDWYENIQYQSKMMNFFPRWCDTMLERGGPTCHLSHFSLGSPPQNPRKTSAASTCSISPWPASCQKSISQKSISQVGLLAIPPSKQTTSWKGTPIRASQDC